jgi:DNA primase
MESPIQEIKERLDIVEVISSYLKLQKTGANYRAVCPFHSEKKPSFFVSPTRQLWRCFGCGKAGDVFTFVQEIEGIEFGDALRILAKKAGVELKKQDPQIETQRKRIYDICELAAKFFEKQLYAGQEGQKAKKYLLQRGIKEESLTKWRIGFAPKSWEGLLSFLKQRGFSIGEIKRAGLILESEKGKVYDRFRGRIIFPIFDLNSQPIGFGGRVFGEDKKTVAKYLNIPNTALYNKSNVLYGLNRAKVPIRKENECILVEGYTDVIMSHQIGIENVVATSGTALTPNQLKILKRYSDKLTTAFDMDIAGDTATKRGIELAQKQGFNIKVATMPQDKDPADVIAENSEQWKELTKGAKSILQFYFDSVFSRFDKKSPEGKKDIAKILLPLLSRIPNKIEQSHWIKDLAKELETREENIEEEMRKLGSSPGPAKEQAEEENLSRKDQKKTRKEIIEEKIVSLILNHPEELKLLNKEFLAHFSSQMRGIIQELKKKPASFQKDFDDFNFSQEIKDFLGHLALEGEEILSSSQNEPLDETKEEIDCDQEISSCLKELKTVAIKEKMAELSWEIKKAEQSGDSQVVEKVLKEFDKLSKMLF